jgi:hypothetical protein
MAQGDVTLFEEYALDAGAEDHDLASDVIKLGIIDNTTPPTAADATPTWGDYSANEVSTAGGYTADGETIASQSWTEANGVATFDGDNITLAQNGSGFTDAYWGILYNSTNASNKAIGFIDLGGPVSEQVGQVEIRWNASGIFTHTVSNS